MNELKTLPRSSNALQKLRQYLLESITQAADEIADIDRQLAILRNQNQ